MQETSELYKTLLADENHRKVTTLEVNGKRYGEDVLVSLKTNRQLFKESKPMVGCCVSGEIRAEMKLPSDAIPRCAELRPFVALTDGTRTSERIPKGVFYIDTRKIDKTGKTNWVALTGYDAMMKAEADFPSQENGWENVTDIQVVYIIAEAMGVGVDPRTVAIMDKGYTVPLPVGYSMRETLGHIAAAYGGNFIMSDRGELLLIQLNGIPQDTNFLVVSEADPRPIEVGGVQILV